MRNKLVAAVVGSGLAAASALAGLPPAVAATTTPLGLTFDRETISGGVFTRFVNSGSARLRVRAVSLNGGEVRRAAGRKGSAADFPAFGGSSGSPRAVIRVRNAGSTDHLDPGSRRLRFGAQFRLDRVSQGGTSVDDGNNLMQRGLYGGRSQFKLQVDGRRPACVVKGDRGRVMVSSPVRVDSRHWYGVRCARDGRAVTIAVTTFRADRRPTRTSRTASGTVGRLSFPTDLPLTVGGKVTSSGTVAAATDQFNGRVDNVYLRIG